MNGGSFNILAIGSRQDLLKLERDLHETSLQVEQKGSRSIFRSRSTTVLSLLPINEKLTMTYQLVLQWNAPNLPTFDELVAIEESLIRAISGHGDVDGHDLGASECNIFIETDDPTACFDTLKAVLGDSLGLGAVLAGYRRLDQEKLEVLWPVGLTSFTVA